MNSINENEVCGDEQRRFQVRAKGRNGLDYVEVHQSQSTSDPADKTTIKVFFIGDAPESLTPANFGIQGGVRILDIRVTEAERVERGEEDLDDYWRLTIDRSGDFSTYTLRVVKPDAKGRPSDEPLDGFDPRYSRLGFTFKAECPTDLDCLPETSCPPPDRPAPEISYLAKDYASFRQLILDRLAVLMPDWQERHVPDLGITLVELLAYVGDYLSYYQDAVGTEAYLNTARQRISVRRHARLIDYALHEGCNARAWVAIEAGTDDKFDPRQLYFITGYNDALRASRVALSEDDLRNVSPTAYEVFEPLDYREKINVYKAHNAMKFYTWGNRECCLPRGATRATLRYQWKTEPKQTDYSGEKSAQRPPGPNYPPKRPPAEPEIKQFLQPGDVLIFIEVKGPKTGAEPDADPSHRHPVRLTKVTPGIDELRDEQIVEIEWSAEDALPFPLCISSIGPADQCCEEITDVSIALGNVILVDHGRTVDIEKFVVPPADEEDAGCEAVGQPRDRSLRPGRFKASLAFGPVTHHEHFPRAETIARSQARLLDGLMKRVRQMVDHLWRKAQAGQSLSTDELDWLLIVFGRQALIQVGLLDNFGKKWRKSPDLAKSIAALAAHEDRWLARKARRVATLRMRAESGYDLEAGAAHEIGAMFGKQFGDELSRSNAVLFGAASAALQQNPRAALPDVHLDEVKGAVRVRWNPRRDLLDSNGNDRHFIAEINNDGLAYLRFGNGELGSAPTANAAFSAVYRVGSGKAGNVGADTISHIVFRHKSSGSSLRPRNPLPARGGVEPESMAEAKMFAPGTFRRELERAIVADDYAQLAERNHKIQRAAAALRWTGSWLEASVAIDPLDSEVTAESLREDIERYLGQYRRMGHDLRVSGARSVPLEIELEVCVLPHYLRGHVEAALQDVFSNRVQPDGRRGFFHPDNLTFGEDVYLSKLIAAAQAVPGVESVRVTVLKRLFEPASDEIENGVLPLNPFEIAQLDSDPNFPERGKLSLKMLGGR